MRRLPALVPLALLAAPLAYAPLAAQEGVVVGRVRSAADSAPVPGAEVLLGNGARTTRADSAGAFRLGGVSAGRHRVVVRRVGFLPAGADVEVRGGDSTDVVVLLRQVPQRLPGVAVVDRVIARRLERFEERRAFGIGHFLGPEELAREGDLPFSAVVRKRLPGFNLVPNPRNGRPYLASSRGAGMSQLPPADPFDPRSPRGCWSQVFLDGTRFYGHQPGAPPMPAPELDAFQTREVLAVEAYTAANVPAEYAGPMARCGTIVLWTGPRR
ncbi:carboxypeptidase-like regulatory domain-containing protein [Roseisolibacter sp. H3M3-2]|uniref:carboxypeptidase-like regulatory domain-containing protein n=1 Tax=Roseisolibacter sp. H3M3-2 TaxID=3031323 RepID=UPI0023DCCDCE|nr:carboxypeptidase-like regulatory domain-containing protein [Roseisolibacter sp. H3M3-2]MDF1505470.1 carboxypeptidase-like regulatory domain-containing protein [Roseisolibacter sp. H3M3-2]